MRRDDEELRALAARRSALGRARAPSVLAFAISTSICWSWARFSPPASSATNVPTPIRAIYAMRRVSAQPRASYGHIPGLAYVELDEASWCCGSAGTYNIAQPEMADAALAAKMDRIRDSGAQVVTSANPGCLLQLQAGTRRYGVPGRVLQLTQLLDLSYRKGEGKAPRPVREAITWTRLGLIDIVRGTQTPAAGFQPLLRRRASGVERQVRRRGHAQLPGRLAGLRLRWNLPRTTTGLCRAAGDHG